jgi:3,2-trans-enoyl-CoA isomerase
MGSLVKVILDAAPRTSMLLLNRAPVNALNTALLTDISKAIVHVEKERGSSLKQGWGLVIAAENAAASSTFSAGLDLSEMYEKSEAQLAEFWTAVQDLWLNIYGTRLATVAAVNGHAPAGGCLITMSCDHRIGAADQPKARIGLNEAKFGLVAPIWFATTLQAAVGTRQADRMLQLGEVISFEDAKRFGLLDELVPRGDLINTALKRAEEWASNGPAEARFQSKILTRKTFLEELRNNRKADIDIFVKRVTAKAVQEDLGRYLASLKKGK